MTADRPTPHEVARRCIYDWGAARAGVWANDIAEATITALHDAGYRIVAADDAAKLDRLRECETDRHFGVHHTGGWTSNSKELLAYLLHGDEQPDGER